MNDIHSKKIFIIDDDEEILILIQSILEKHGFDNVFTFENSDDVFKKMLYEKPDLLFMDIILPGADGINLSEAIDTIYEQGIPTIFMSSERSFEQVIEVHKFNKPTHFVAKPLSSDTIVRLSTIILNQMASIPETIPKMEKFTKPWPILIIATILFFEPLLKILYFNVTKDMDFSTIFSNVIQIDNLKHWFEFWLLFPLSGILLFNIKRWAYYGFFILQIYALWMHFTYTSFSWPFSTAFPHLSSFLLLIINIGIIIYFLIPAIRRPYFDKNLRPWEKGPEYHININCMVVNKENGEILPANLIKISKHNATITLTNTIPINTSVLLSFTFYHFHFSIIGKITKYIQPNNNDLFHYIEFNMIQYGDKVNFKKFLKALSIIQKAVA